jgi:hypothetical protein
MRWPGVQAPEVMRAASCAAICSGSDNVSGAGASAAAVDGAAGLGDCAIRLSYWASCQIVNNLIDNKTSARLG